LSADSLHGIAKRVITDGAITENHGLAATMMDVHRMDTGHFPK